MIQIAVFDNEKTVRDDIIKLLTRDRSIGILGVGPATGDSVFTLSACGADIILIGAEHITDQLLEKVTRITKAFPQIPVLAFMRTEDDQAFYKYLTAGVTACLLITQLAESLIPVIYELYAGDNKISTSVLNWTYKLLHKHERTDQLKPANYNLTQREKEIVSYIITGVSYKMIADNLHISYETIRSHMKNIHIKLQVSTTTELVIKALNEGVAD